MPLLTLETWPLFWCWQILVPEVLGFAVSLLYRRVIFNPQPLSTVPGQMEHFSEFMWSCHWLTCLQCENITAGSESSFGLEPKPPPCLRAYVAAGTLPPWENLGVDKKKKKKSTHDCWRGCNGFHFSVPVGNTHEFLIWRCFNMKEGSRINNQNNSPFV